MLSRLSVSNYILIRELNIVLRKGFTTITGETGAGKSILLGALGLLSGARADSMALMDKSRKCIIEGAFEVSDYGLEEFFSEHELDFDTECIVRREINPEGKSRAFVNDTPVNLNLLRQLCNRLIDIHSQHETLLLSDSRFQLNFIDGVAGNSASFLRWKKLYHELKEADKYILALKEEEQRSRSESDYLSFQLDELQQLKLLPGEQPALEAEQQKLEHAGDIISAVENAVYALRDADESLLSRLNTITQSIEAIVKLDDRYQDWLSRLKSTKIELKDIADEMSDTIGGSQPDPDRLENINERLSTIYQLVKKHRVSGSDDLINLALTLEERLKHFSSLEHQIADKESQREKIVLALQGAGKELKASRNKVIPQLEKSLLEFLRELSMPHATIKINVIDLPEPGPEGMERIQFLFSANKGSEYKELSKVASGGEMSRLMLAIKAIMAKHTAMPTVLFDEIDTGISGEAAAKAARILKEMAQGHQVICITHLPQMASKGDHHLFVYKEVVKGNTFSGIRMLESDERVHEIARLLSGEQLSEAALENARELLSASGG